LAGVNVADKQQRPGGVHRQIYLRPGSNDRMVEVAAE
jgi:hypothetical protein